MRFIYLVKKDFEKPKIFKYNSISLIIFIFKSIFEISLAIKLTITFKTINITFTLE